MRLVSLLCVLAALGCSANTAPSSGSDASVADTKGIDIGGFLDFGTPAETTCAPSTIVVRSPFPLPDGILIRNAKITSAKVDHTTSPATLNATLEGGGTLSLRWKGDARTSLVNPYGSVTWDGSTTWCIDSHSEMRFTDENDIVFERFTIGEDPGLVADDRFDLCHQPSDGGVPPPLPAIVQYEACAALPP